MRKSRIWSRSSLNQPSFQCLIQLESGAALLTRTRDVLHLQCPHVDDPFVTVFGYGFADLAHDPIRILIQVDHLEVRLARLEPVGQ